MAEDLQSLEYTPTWVVAAVCFVIVFISFGVERLLHHLGKFFKHKKQDALYEALQKLKEELMLLGFISLLLTVFQGLISQICIPEYVTANMLPCKREEKEKESSSEHGVLNNVTFAPATFWNGRRLLSESAKAEYCAHKGKVPLLSLEGLHHLHIFIFVLAIVHMIFCVTTMLLGGAKIRQWAHWEKSIRHDHTESVAVAKVKHDHAHHHLEFFRLRAVGFWRKSVVISWIRAFFKQFYGSLTKSDYIAMRLGFIMRHTPANHDFDFHKYMMRTLEIDFKKIVGISWYLWLFLVFFLLLNVRGWHTYFWLAFLPFALLLLVGAKLEHIITELAEEVAERKTESGAEPVKLKLNDNHFWFGKPALILYLIHFILFQNAFEIAFFFWIMSTYGFTSCIIEKLGYIIPRLLIGVIIQVLCSYSTLPLYAIVSQMGSTFKQGIFDEYVASLLGSWLDTSKRKAKSGSGSSTRITSTSRLEMQKTTIDALGHSQPKCPLYPLEEITTSEPECSDSNRTQTPP